MRKFSLTLSILLAASFLLAACSVAPATVVVVVTNTVDPNVIQVTVTPAPANTAANTQTTAPTAISVVPTSTPVVLAATTVATSVPATVKPTDVPITPVGSSPTANPYLAEVRAQLYVAQQDFENGYMFWISSQKVIWVLFKSNGNESGEWQSFPDSWVEGTDPEIDPNITPPSGDRYQPRRGFGKLWRTTQGLREALGWAKTPEFALNTVYVYQPAGHFDDKGNWIAEPGKHFITALDRKTFVLSEPVSAGARGKWEKQPGS
jgi:hypothetical protein